MVSKEYVQTAHPYDRDLASLGAWIETGFSSRGPWWATVTAFRRCDRHWSIGAHAPCAKKILRAPLLELACGGVMLQDRTQRAARKLSTPTRMGYQTCQGQQEPTHGRGVLTKGRRFFRSGEDLGRIVNRKMRAHACSTTGEAKGGRTWSKGAHTFGQHGSGMNRTRLWGGKDVTPIQTSCAGRRVLRRPAQ
jgi:hypothetical protein